MLSLVTLSLIAAAPAPPVTALAYRPDGQLLAAGTYQRVELIDPAKRQIVASLVGQTSRVTALAFSSDGQRLAVASGTPGKSGEVRVYSVANPLKPVEPVLTITAHADIVYAVAFSPDGKLLASTGYDRLVKLWNTTDGTPIRTLKDHSDAVYALAFHPEGKLLATGSADRAVKIWDVASGNRLYTLSDPTDWVYAVAFSPDGTRLAAGGVDRSVRVWTVNATGGTLVGSAFAHDGPVTRLAYGPKGETLFSLGEDRVLKVWDAAALVEKRVYERQSDQVLSLAIRPDRGQIALGRFDGALVLLDEATGKPQGQPLPVPPKPPVIGKVVPDAVPRGRATRVTITGTGLDAVTAVMTSVPAKLLPETRSASSVQVELSPLPSTAIGLIELSVKSAIGESAKASVSVDAYTAIPESGRNDAARSAQAVTLPTTVVGTLDRAGDADYYRFEAKAGQPVGVLVVPAAGSKVEPVVQLTDTAGQVLAESSTRVLGYSCLTAGVYVLAVRDREYRGGAEFGYRLHAGDLPVVTTVFPPGVQRGTTAEVKIEGVNLPAATAKVTVPADAVPGSRIPVPLTTPHGPPLGETSVVAGEFAEVSAGEAMPVPGTANGRLSGPGAMQTWSFPARKGQRLAIEIHARRIGSSVDSVIEVLDASGKPVSIATLRSLARTFTVFRDHDSVTSGIRIEAWNELAVNDYVMVGNELLKILALPRNPDDNCVFFNAGGQRLGFLHTTPSHHSVGVPVYKVGIHPPGTTFPPNGMPVFTLTARNDDGGPGFGKDSFLLFDPPADGTYRVRVSDARGEGGPDAVYRLTVRSPRPDYTVKLSVPATVARGGAVPVTITADRTDGFDGRIDVRLDGFPAGLSAPPTFIEPGLVTTTVSLAADANAAPAKGTLKLVATATIDGKPVTREASAMVPTVGEPGDVIARTVAQEVRIKPGEEARLTVSVERRNGFTGRVPLDVLGLPHGVRVLHVGLNGILVLPGETTRTIALYAEPWVKPMSHPLVVTARREGKPETTAAPSVLLTVGK